MRPGVPDTTCPSLETGSGFTQRPPNFFVHRHLSSIFNDPWKTVVRRVNICFLSHPSVGIFSTHHRYANINQKQWNISDSWFYSNCEVEIDSTRGWNCFWPLCLWSWVSPLGCAKWTGCIKGPEDRKTLLRALKARREKQPQGAFHAFIYFLGGGSGPLSYIVLLDTLMEEEQNVDGGFSDCEGPPGRED